MSNLCETIKLALENLASETVTYLKSPAFKNALDCLAAECIVYLKEQSIIVLKEKLSIASKVEANNAPLLCEIINSLANQELITISHLTLFEDISGHVVPINRPHLSHLRFTFPVLKQLFEYKNISDDHTKITIIDWLTVIVHWIRFNEDAPSIILDYTSSTGDSLCGGKLLDSITKEDNLKRLAKFLHLLPKFVEKQATTSTNGGIVIVYKPYAYNYNVTPNDQHQPQPYRTSINAFEIKTIKESVLTSRQNIGYGEKLGVHNKIHTIFISKAYEMVDFCSIFPFARALIEYHKTSGLKAKIDAYLNHKYSAYYTFIDESVQNIMQASHAYSADRHNSTTNTEGGSIWDGWDD